MNVLKTNYLYIHVLKQIHVLNHHTHEKNPYDLLSRITVSVCLNVNKDHKKKIIDNIKDLIRI